MDRNTKPLGFGLVFAGLLLFFNPFFASVDILPDFIGCLLIFFGLSRLSRIYAPIAEVRARFLKLAAVDIVKDIVLTFIFTGGSSAERPTALLSAAFGATVVSLYFLLPAVSSLFTSVTEIAMSGDCPTFYREYAFGRSRGEFMARCSVIFLLLRDLLCLLPEFSALLTSTYTETGVADLYEYIGVMRVISAMLVLIVGAVWIGFLISFFHALRKEKAFREMLGIRYGVYADAHPGMPVERRHFAAFLCLSIGAFLTADFYLDFQNIIPDPLAAAFFLSGVLLLDISPKKRSILAALAAAFGAVATWSTARAYDFATNYKASDIARDPEVAGVFRGLWISSILEFLVFLGFVGALLYCLRDTVKKHAGYRPVHTDLQFEERRARELREEFDGIFIKTMLFALLAGLFSFLFDYMKDVPSAGLFRILEFFWFFDMAMSLVFAAIFANTLSTLFAQIKKKFMFDGIEGSALLHTTYVPQNQKREDVTMQNRNQNNNQSQNQQNQNSQNNQNSKNSKNSQNNQNQSQNQNQNY